MINYIINADTCVCCGDIIPEGSHVCSNCRDRVNRPMKFQDFLKYKYQLVIEDFYQLDDDTQKHIEDKYRMWLSEDTRN